MPARTLCATASIAVLSAFALGAAAQAQETAAPATVDALIVTAQKREQNLQDVPIVVNVVPRQLLQDAGVRDIKDLTLLTPGLIVTSTASEVATTARIRGVGTVGDNPGLESSVGIVIDGVYRPRNGVSFGDLGELDRVEVLKGPQGTLFGKNTSAGVINVLTAAPTFKFGGQAQVDVGSYSGRGASLTLNGPLAGDVVAGRLFLAARQRDGYNDVIVAGGPRTSGDDADLRDYTARGQLLFAINDQSSLRLIADYSRRKENCCSGVQLRTGPSSAIVNGLAAGGQGLATTADPGARTAYSNRPATQQMSDAGVSAEANIATPIGKFTSISALRHWKARTAQDADFTGADILYRADDDTNFVEFNTFSQEFRLAGQTKALDWLTGAMFTDETLLNTQNFLYGSAYESYLSTLLVNSAASNLGAAGFNISTANGQLFASQGTGRAFGTVFPTGQGLRDRFRQSARSAALFTNETVHFTDALDLNLGLRFTRENKTDDTKQTITDGGAGCGAAMANPSGFAAALVGRAPTSQQAALGTALGGATGAALLSNIVGTLCQTWANPRFDNRVTTQKRDEDAWSGTAKLAYRWSPQVMTYGSYARGYKGGGFNLDRTQSVDGTVSGGSGLVPILDTSFPAEFVNSYEIGAKTTLMDRRLVANVAVFDQRYTNFQLNIFLGTSFVVRSIPEVNSKGVDADLIWFTPVEGWTVQGGVTYAQTKYGSQKAPGDPGNVLALLPNSRLSFAPVWSVAGSTTYSMPVASNLVARFNAGVKYNSSYNTGSDLFPLKTQSAFALLNARVGIGSRDQLWTVELWGENLTDKNYVQVAFSGPLQGSSGLSASNATYNPALDTITYDGFLGAPRTWGVTLRSKF